MNEQQHQLEDQILVMDAQDGDGRAMEMLVKRWQRRLWRHALRLTGDEQAAWDVTQSAWYDIIRRLRRLHDPASFPAWAYKITTCKAIDWIKRKRPTVQFSDETVRTLPDRPAPDTGVDELLDKLPVHQRAVLCLYYYENLSIAEIGEAMNIPAGTVKSRLHTARGAFKQLWEHAEMKGYLP